jgi:Mannosyl-glycoprotein endo-beta-N-acetylglucosaminidase
LGRRESGLLYADTPRDVLAALNDGRRRADVSAMPRSPVARPSRRALVLCAVAAATIAAALGPSARAATGPASPTTTTRPRGPERPDAQSYRALAAEVARNTNRIAELAAELERVNSRIADLDAQIAFTQQRLDETRAEIARYRGIVRDRAAFIYRHARAPQGIFDIAHIEQVSSGKQYAESASSVDIGKIDELTRVASVFDAHLHELQDAREQQRVTRDRLQSDKSTLEAVTARQQKLLDEAGTITVMGDSELTGEQIAAWFQARGGHARLSGNTTITDLASLFVEEGAAEHVRGDIAFAQSILETGWFAHALDNNYGGIGACDSCKGEIAFATPREGVRGQIQMLRNYGDPASRAATLANPPSPPIYGRDPVAAAQSYDTFFAKGRVPTWNLMGNGNWATAAGYAPRVLGLYFDMVAFAARQD